MVDGPSQTDEILDALLRGESLTPLDALRRFGCMRLGARIWDIKQLGYQVITEWESDGDKKRRAKYRIKSDQLHLAM